MSTALPAHKTKIVATIGPASESPEMLAAAHPRGAERRAAEFLARRVFQARGSGHAHPRGRSARRAGASRSWPICRGRRCGSGRSSRSRSSSCRATSFTLTNEDIVGDAQRVSMSFEPLPRVVKAGQPALSQRRPRAARRRARRGQRRGVHRRGRRRAAFAQGAESAGHRSRHQRVHRARSRVPGVCARRGRGCGEPVVRRAREGHRGRARRGGEDRARAVHHREDRALRRARALRRNPRRRRWHHGRARRSRRGGADRGNRAHAEAAHRESESRGQTGHHRHADARVDGQRAACPRAPRRPTWPTRSSTAPIA